MRNTEALGTKSSVLVSTTVCDCNSGTSPDYGPCIQKEECVSPVHDKEWSDERNRMNSSVETVLMKAIDAK